MSRKYWLIFPLALLLVASAGYWSLRGSTGKEQVLQKLEQGTTEEELIESIRSYEGEYELDVGDIIDLKKRGVPENALWRCWNTTRAEKKANPNPIQNQERRLRAKTLIGEEVLR